MLSEAEKSESMRAFGCHEQGMLSRTCHLQLFRLSEGRLSDMTHRGARVLLAQISARAPPDPLARCYGHMSTRDKSIKGENS